MKFKISYALALTLIITLTFTSQIPHVKATLIRVPQDYPTIQQAVDVAINGDTVQVSPGTYHENIIISTSITLTGLNPTTTTIDGSYNGIVIELNASSVTITSLTVQNSATYGIYIVDFGTQTITNNIIKNNVAAGIYMQGDVSPANNNLITGNTFLNNSMTGIRLSNSDNNNINNNTIDDSANGIYIENGSTDNQITNNTITNVSFGIYMTELASTTTRNTASRNHITSKLVGIYVINSDTVQADHNTITEQGGYGIYYYNSRTGTITYNKLTNGSYGMRLYMPAATITNHVISHNKIANNDWGIDMYNTRSNTMEGNWIEQNTWGIYMLGTTTGNTIYHNDFVRNALQVSWVSGNTWSSGGQGNYWTDYRGLDNGAGGRTAGDGIGDTLIPHQGVDNFPLMQPWSIYDIAVLSVTPTPTTANIGQTVNIAVQVKNQGHNGLAQSFTVTAKHNSTAIETKPVNNLPVGTTQNLTFNWNTTGLTPGNYTISAEASVVPDELYTGNNKLTDGTVRLYPSIHDVAVRSVTTSPTIGYSGYGNILIHVDVKNEGSEGETFNVTVYRNSTAIETQTTTVAAGANNTLTFTWDLTAAPTGYFSISATAGPVAGELDLTDNTLNGNSIRIRIPGDVNGDRIVDILDMSTVSAHWYPGPPVGPLGYDSNSDINGDAAIDILDVAIVSAHWGNTEP